MATTPSAMVSHLKHLAPYDDPVTQVEGQALTYLVSFVDHQGFSYNDQQVTIVIFPTDTFLTHDSKLVAAIQDYAVDNYSDSIPASRIFLLTYKRGI